MIPRDQYVRTVVGIIPRREIAKRLGISPNALSSWCRKHKISMALKFEYLNDNYKRQKAKEE